MVPYSTIDLRVRVRLFKLAVDLQGERQLLRRDRASVRELAENPRRAEQGQAARQEQQDRQRPDATKQFLSDGPTLHRRCAP
jgi:hypothetical protein